MTTLRLYRRFIPIMLLVCLGCSRELMISNPKRPVISPERLEVHGDQITFDVMANVPGGTLTPGVVYRLVPQFTYGNSRLDLSPMEFTGSRRPQEINETYTFDYAPDFDDGELGIQGNFTDTKTGEKAAYRIPLTSTKGVITTSRLLWEDYRPAYSVTGPYYVKTDTLRLDFAFALGDDELSPSAINQALNRQLDSLISSDVVILDSRVIGTHSPVGSDEVNRRIAQSRASRVEEVYRSKIANRTFNKHDQLEADIEVDFNSWQIFLEKMQETDLWATSGEQVNEILSTSDDYQSVKSRLAGLRDFSKISRVVFPKLQMSRLEISYGVTIRSRDQLTQIEDQIIGGDASFSAQDIVAIAQQEPNARRRLELYESSEGSSWQLFNDWASTYLDSYHLWDEHRASNHLSIVYDRLIRAVKLQPSSPAYINLGIVNSIAGRFGLSQDFFDKAESLLDEADSSTTEAYNDSRAVAFTKSGNYRSALQSFHRSSAGEAWFKYNHGLAKLLAGDQKSAIGILNEALELGSDSARTFYTQAIASNRARNEKGAIQYLSSAFRINPRYNDYFHRDHEFENLNKGIFHRYPDSLKIPVRDFKKLQTYELPILAYPSPTPSYQLDISDSLSSRFGSYGEVHNFVISTLVGLGWKKEEMITFELPKAGFAVVARLEQIDASGLSMFPPDRWEPQVRFRSASDPDDFLGNYEESIRNAYNGSYRLIVFIVTDSTGTSSPGQAELLEAGRYELSKSIEGAQFGNGNITFQVYEFRKSSQDGVKFVEFSTIDHYSRLGLHKRLATNDD